MVRIAKQYMFLLFFFVGFNVYADNKKEEISIFSPSIEFEVTNYTISNLDFHLLKWGDSVSTIESDQVLLRWVVKDAESIEISSGLGSLDARGYIVLRPDSNITYILTARNTLGNSVTKEITVVIKKLEQVVPLKISQLVDMNADISNELFRIGKPVIPYLVTELKKILMSTKAFSTNINSRAVSEKDLKKIKEDGFKIVQITDILGYIRDPDSISAIMQIIDIPATQRDHYGTMFDVLKMFGKNQIIKEYAIAKLNDYKSSPRLIRAALDCLTIQNEEGLAIYAVKFMDSKYDFSVREMAVYLAAKLSIPNLKKRIIALLNNNKGRQSFFDLYALARVSSPDELKADIARLPLPKKDDFMTWHLSNAVGGTPLLPFFKKQVAVAENLSFFYHASLMDKELVVERLMASKTRIEMLEGLRYIFINNRADLLEKYNLIPDEGSRALLDININAGLLVDPVHTYLLGKNIQSLVFSFDGVIMGAAESPILFIKK